MKLNVKLGILMIVSSIVGLIVFIAMTLVIADTFGKGYSPNDLNAIGHQLAQEAGEADASPERIIDLLHAAVAKHPQFHFEWVENDGTLIYATNDRTDDYTFGEITSRFLNIPDRFWETGTEITMAFALGNGPNPQYVIMHTPDEAMQGSQAQIMVKEYSDLVWLILPFLLFLATPYFVSFLFVVRMNRRLKKLITAMNNVDAEKPVITIKDRSKDEIGQLTRHFNSMSQRINEQFVQIQEFERSKQTLIANISHDLRTPMTTIQGFSETLYEELDESDHEKKTYAEMIMQRSRYMDKLLQRLLEISQLDSRKVNIELKEANISAHMRKIAADFVHILERKNFTFDVHIPDQPIYALTDSYLLERAIRNLIENAIAYGSSGSYVGIAVEGDEREVRICVIDRGRGIPQKQLPLIFERFYRGSGARQGDGMGIGLSIVQEIAKIHHGRIEVESAVNRQTVFTLILPATKKGYLQEEKSHEAV